MTTRNRRATPMSKMHRSTVLVVAGVIAHLAADPSLASDKSMRCGGSLIHAGGGRDSALMYEVLKKCGEPEARHGYIWVYRQGNVRRILTFNIDGRLQRIETRRT